MSEATHQHRTAAAGRRAKCGVLTVSDTRTVKSDRGGGLIIERLQAEGHEIVEYQIVRDEPVEIHAVLQAWLNDGPRFDVLLSTGGTGISTRDTTVEIVRQLLTKPLDGFGELFRMLSYEQVGAAAMLSRAVGGLAGQTLLFALPGSTNAVQLALEQLILPELPHLIWERAR